MSKRRVVVTGMGLLTPVGNDLESAWTSLLAGKSGISLIEHFDVSAQAVKIAGSIKAFDASFLSGKEARKMDLFIQYGLYAALQAFRDANFQVTEENADRVGVAIGSGIGGLPGIEKNHSALLQGGPRKVSPFFVPSTIINMISGHLSIMLGLKGPNIAISTACSTGLHNIGEAARIISTGDADFMLAGGAEMATCPLALAGFASARAISDRNDAPHQASRPFDKDRDGFVLGDGAGIMALEEYEQAKRRGTRIYAELIGYGLGSDAYHMTAPPENGEGAQRAMQNALKSAAILPEAVDYINAHGTSTLLGDLAETRAIKAAYGKHAYQVAISSTKSMTGHLLGAAGSVEAIIAVLSIRDQMIPPTINLDNPGDECDLNYTPHTARQWPVSIAATNSFGFGGTNGTLIFKKM